MPFQPPSTLVSGTGPPLLDFWGLLLVVSFLFYGINNIQSPHPISLNAYRPAAFQKNFCSHGTPCQLPLCYTTFYVFILANFDVSPQHYTAEGGKPIPTHLLQCISPYYTLSGEPGPSWMKRWLTSSLHRLFPKCTLGSPGWLGIWLLSVSTYSSSKKEEVLPAPVVSLSDPLKCICQDVLSCDKSNSSSSYSQWYFLKTSLPQKQKYQRVSSSPEQIFFSGPIDLSPFLEMPTVGSAKQLSTSVWVGAAVFCSRFLGTVKTVPLPGGNQHFLAKTQTLNMEFT